jgi:type IV pilus assembly protein PilV
MSIERNILPDPHEKGFTLIEVMISILILSIGILAIASMQGSAVRGNTSGRKYTEATATATAWLEFLSTLTWDDALLVDTDGDGDTGLDDGIDAKAGVAPDQQTVEGDFDVFWNIANNHLVSGTRTVALYVTWQDRGMTRSVRTQYVVAQRF